MLVASHRRNATSTLAWLALGHALGGCGARSAIDDQAVASPCRAVPPTCIAPSDDPCGESSVVSPTCDARSLEWSCPAGSRLYARAPELTTVCLPFRAASIASIGPWGLSAMTHVPTDDGRCLWIADSVTLNDGTSVRNVAFQPDPTAPFGTCPANTLTPPSPVVTVESGDDPSVLVQINGAFRLSGTTHVLYRIFRADSAATFGAILVGGGVGRWDQATQRIVIPSATPPFPWGTDLDLGDASLLEGDGVHAYVWGCARPGMNLLQGCELARLDAQDDVELFSTGGGWIPSTNPALGAVLFGSGSWSSSVVSVPAGLRDVFVIDFGSTLQSHVASAATGPWVVGPDLAACDLPSDDDPGSFCAGPIVHGELSDPTRPGELAVTYGVGSSAEIPPGPPIDYWPRLIWTQ